MLSFLAEFLNVFISIVKKFKPLSKIVSLLPNVHYRKKSLSFLLCHLFFSIHINQSLPDFLLIIYLFFTTILIVCRCTIYSSYRAWRHRLDLCWLCWFAIIELWQGTWCRVLRIRLGLGRVVMIEMSWLLWSVCLIVWILIGLSISCCWPLPMLVCEIITPTGIIKTSWTSVRGGTWNNFVMCVRRFKVSLKWWKIYSRHITEKRTGEIWISNSHKLTW